MTPDQIKLLRRLAINDGRAMSVVLTGAAAEFDSLDPRTEALIRIVALLSLVPDETSLGWAMDEALAAGVEDADVFGALIVVAPIIGVARLIAALPYLMKAADLDVIEG